MQPAYPESFRRNLIKGVLESSAAVERTPALILREIAEENDWKNALVLFWLPDRFRCSFESLEESFTSDLSPKIPAEHTEDKSFNIHSWTSNALH